MPITRSQIPVTQEKCKVCRTNTVNKVKDKAVECDICQEWICLKCSGLPEQMYNYSQDNESNLDFICKPCKVELPKIREIMTMKQKQLEIIADMKKESEINKKFREDQIEVNEDLNQRLSKIETVMLEKQLDDKEYPPLRLLNKEKEKVNKILIRQQKLDEEVKQQKNDKEEEKRREIRENNLIVYGIPEVCEDDAEQMKVDFTTVKVLYQHKVDLAANHITQITRLGQKKENQTRPIRLTFSSEDKRLEVLRNNKNLTLEDDNFELCTLTFCDDHQNHKHIYVSPDKTKQQRDIEKKLREELKARKKAGEENLIIRGEKIIKKSEKTHARWSDLIKDGGF